MAQSEIPETPPLVVTSRNILNKRINFHVAEPLRVLSSLPALAGHPTIVLLVNDRCKLTNSIELLYNHKVATGAETLLVLVEG